MDVKKGGRDRVWEARAWMLLSRASSYAPRQGGHTVIDHLSPFYSREPLLLALLRAAGGKYADGSSNQKLRQVWGATKH